MIEPGTAVTVAAVAHALGLNTAGAEFLKRIVAKPGDDIGEIVSHFSTRRLRNWVLATDEAGRLAADAGGSIGEVPLRTLTPIIEGASNEEDANMRARWAALMANAAIAPDSLPPLYPRTLSNLSPPAAFVLDRLYELEEFGAEISQDATATAPRAEDELERWGYSVEEIQTLRPAAATATIPADVATSIGELSALGLVEQEPAIRTDRGPSYRITDAKEYRLSVVGRGLVKACRPPQPPPDPAR